MKIKNPIVVIKGGGGGPTQEKTVELALASGNQEVLPDTGYSLSKVTITKPDTLLAANIKYGVIIAGVTGSLITGTNPQLNSPTIAKSSNTVTITNPSTNGNFVKSYKLLNNGVVFQEQTGASVNLQNIPHNSYILTCKCSNTDVGFIDSESSSSITLTVFAFSDCTSNLDTTFDWENNSNGISLSFTITPKTGYYLPPSVDIMCNGETLDYTYNPYTGEVSIAALKLNYSGTPSDKGQLPEPVIKAVDNDNDTADVLSGAGTESFDVYYDDGSLIGNALNAGADATTIEIGAFAVESPKLVAPLISLDEDELSIVDGYIGSGDTFYAEYYDLYVDGVVEMSDIDATEDQKCLITYNDVKNYAVNGEYHKSTNTGSQTYGLLKVNIIAPKTTTVKITFTAYTRSSYCYAYLGKLDAQFSDTYSQESSSNYYAAYTTSTTTNSNYTLSVPAGAHFIYFKFWRGSTTSYSDRYLQVKVEEVTT